MNRRRFVQQTAGMVLAAAGSVRLGRRVSWAQEATPEASALAGLGLPEVHITLTAQGFTASPSSVAEGWTLISFTNDSEQGANSPDIMRLPPGETVESVLASNAMPEGATPAWVHTTSWAGGPVAKKGETAQAVVHLTAGDWLVYSGGEPYPGAPLTVTAGDGGVVPALTADVRVSLQEYGFAGLEQPVPAGPRLWQVTNDGTQPHVMNLVTVPDGTTTQQLLVAMQGMMSGTPEAGGVDLSTVTLVAGCAVQSTGQSVWLPVVLVAGTYAALCFFPDRDTGAPHVLMGMGQVFTAA